MKLEPAERKALALCMIPFIVLLIIAFVTNVVF